MDLADNIQLAPSHGKRRLVEAALRIAARDGNGLSSLGLRELAREAGLNANTFYRHFDGLEALGEAAARQLATRIMAGMRDVRRKAARHADATAGAVRYFFDFVRRNPEAFRAGLREIHGARSPMRRTLLEVLERIAVESVDQIVELNLVPGVEPPVLLHATRTITYLMFYRALDYLERPRERVAIAAELIWAIRAVFLGARAQITSAGKSPVRRSSRESNRRR